MPPCISFRLATQTIASDGITRRALTPVASIFPLVRMSLQFDKVPITQSRSDQRTGLTLMYCQLNDFPNYDELRFFQSRVQFISAGSDRCPKHWDTTAPRGNT